MMATRTTVPNRPDWLDDMRQKADEVQTKMLAEEGARMLEAAIEYFSNGLRPVPIHPHKEKPLPLLATRYRTISPGRDGSTR